MWCQSHYIEVAQGAIFMEGTIQILHKHVLGLLGRLGRLGRLGFWASTEKKIWADYEQLL